MKTTLAWLDEHSAGDVGGILTPWVVFVAAVMLIGLLEWPVSG